MKNRGEIILEHLNIQEEEKTKYNGGNNAHTNNNNNYKSCPQCGQGLIPIKYGMCICGKQVGFRQFLVAGAV